MAKTKSKPTQPGAAYANALGELRDALTLNLFRSRALFSALADCGLSDEDRMSLGGLGRDLVGGVHEQLNGLFDQLKGGAA